MKFIKYTLISILGYIATIGNMILDKTISSSNLRMIGIACVVFALAINLDRVLEKHI